MKISRGAFIRLLIVAMLFLMPQQLCAELKVGPGKQVRVKAMSPDDVVRRLYRDFPAEGNKSIDSQKRDVLSRYFVRELVDLFIKIQECEKREGGICGPDFMLLYDAQDYEITEFRVGTFDPAKKTVEVRFKNYGQPVSILYKMKNTPAGWLVSDIIYQKGQSLLKLLKLDAK